MQRCKPSPRPLPYNDVQVRLTFGANVSVECPALLHSSDATMVASQSAKAAASMLIAIPPIFVVMTQERWFVDVSHVSSS